MEKEIIPAIIAKTQEELVERIGKVKDHASVLQLDVMDNSFVPNSSIDFDFTLPETDCGFEAHLMVDDPISWIKRNCDKVDTILAPIEKGDPEKIIKLVKEKGKRVGFAVNPETAIEKVKPYLEKVDQVLVLTVKPGFYGSDFVPSALDKVRELRQAAPGLDIEVDGGIDDGTIGDADRAGANLFVSGSFIMGADDPAAAIAALKKGIGKEVDSGEEEDSED